jgi:probable phosphomutase (TIGR03848 family)
MLTDKGLTECDYGEWQGRPLKELAKEPLWKVVQSQPSAATFPGGESLGTMQARVVDAVRRRDAAVEKEHGPGAVWAAVSHGDLVKALLADALGMHLDLFQRLHVDPASISIVRYTATRPFVLATNTHDGDLTWLAPPAKKGRRRAAASADAAVGGGAGPVAPDV